MSTLDDLIVKIGIDDGDLEQQADQVSRVFTNKFALITAGITAAGGALELFARSQQDANIQTRQLAASLGISEDAMRNLALETANVGFPLDEVLDLMETGKQLGIRSAEGLREYAEFWDLVGDATGESATELGRAGVALASMGIEAGNEAEALAALGFIQEHSTQTAADFLGILGRLGPDLNETGLDINGTAALLAILEQEMGMTGRAARGELTEALSASDGTFQGLIDTLGISKETFDGYVSTVESSEGVLQRNADIVDESFTPMQKAQHWAQELQYQYGDLAEVAGNLALPLMALGPALGAAKWAALNAKLIVTKGIMLAIKVATIAWTAVQWLLNVALNANPIGLVVLAVVALIAIGFLLWKYWDQIVAALGVAWQWIWDKLKAFGLWFWDTFWTNGLKKVIDLLVGAWNFLVDVHRRAFQQIREWIGKGLDFLLSIPGKIKDAFLKVVGFISAPFKAAFNLVSGFWNRTIGAMSWTVPSWVPGIGGNSISAPKLPTLHEGGIVPGRGDVPILAKGGEGVFTPEQMQAMGESAGVPAIILQGDGRGATQLLLRLFAEAIKGQGLQVVVR